MPRVLLSLPSCACRLVRLSGWATPRSIRSSMSLTPASSSRIAVDSERITDWPGPDRRCDSSSSRWSVNGSGASPCSSRTSRGTRALAVGQRHQVKQFLEQMARRLVGRADQQLLELAVDAREQLLARLARQQLAIDDRLDRRGADPAQPRTGHPAVQAVEARQRAAHQLEAGIEVLFADQAEQADLVHVAHPPAFLAQFGFGRQVVDGSARRPRDIQAGAEEELSGSAGCPAAQRTSLIAGKSSSGSPGDWPRRSPGSGAARTGRCPGLPAGRRAPR